MMLFHNKVASLETRATLSPPAVRRGRTFGLQVAEVMEAIFPDLDPTGRAVYLALFWRAYGQRESWCEISQEALAAACGVTRRTVKAALKALAIARLISVEQGGTKSHATRYRVHLAREAGIRRYWEVSPAWRSALRGSEAPMLLTLLDKEDRALLEGMYGGLRQGDRDRLLQEAVRILRARGWRRPELAGEDLEKMMQELLLQRTFGPERLRKYREWMDAGGVPAREQETVGQADSLSRAKP